MNQILIENEYKYRNMMRIVIFISLLSIFFMMQYSPNIIEGFTFDLDQMVKGYEHGSIYRKVSIVALGVIGVLGLFLRRKNDLTFRFVPGLAIVFYLIYACSSVVWAEDPYLTFKRTISVLILCLCVWMVLRIFTLRDMLLFLIATSGTYILIGFVYEIATGKFSPLKEGYRFAGMFHPNSLGLCCALLFIACISMSSTTGRQRTIWLVAAFLALTCLVLTKSRTSLVAAGFAVVSSWMLVMTMRQRLILLLVGSWSLCLLVLLVGDDIFITAWKAILLGRGDSDTATLSGRTMLWEQCLEYAANRPILGFGLGGFWSAQHVFEISTDQGWSVGIGHSTYIDQLLELGSIGLGTYLLILFESTRRAVFNYVGTADSGHAFVFALLVFTAAMGFLETVIPYPSFFAFIVFWAIGYLAFVMVPSRSKEVLC